MNVSNKQTVPVEIAEESFGAEVLQSKQPVLVEFWAPWSRPCKILDSILKDIGPEWQGAAKVVRVNADDNPDLSLCYDIQSVPTILFFLEGKLRSRIVGTATKEAILARLKGLGAPAQAAAAPDTLAGRKCGVLKRPAIQEEPLRANTHED
jgi:thioredoxin 1